MKTLMTIAVCALILSLNVSANAEQSVLEVIPLNYRTVEEVTPILLPFVERGGSLSGLNGQLIVRATPANLAQLRDILRKIDTLPRQLHITVSQDEQRNDNMNRAEVSGRVSIGEHGQVVLPERSRDGAGVEYRRGNDHLRGNVVSRQSQSNSGATQQLTVLEGKQAFIHVGSAIPLPQSNVTYDSHGARIVNSVAYRDVTTGFTVLPRLNGDRVTLEINPQRDSLSSDKGGQINIQHMQTSVSARLGEWMEIGGTLQNENVQRDGIAERSSGAGSERRKIWLKVEEAR